MKVMLSETTRTIALGTATAASSSTKVETSSITVGDGVVEGTELTVGTDDGRDVSPGHEQPEQSHPLRVYKLTQVCAGNCAQ